MNRELGQLSYQQLKVLDEKLLQESPLYQEADKLGLLRLKTILILQELKGGT